MEADASLFGAAIGLALFLILAVVVVVLCLRAQRRGVGFEGEIKAVGFSFRLKSETHLPGSEILTRTSHKAKANDLHPPTSQHGSAPATKSD